MCAALEHPLVHLVAHPTGRIIGRREGYDVDVEKVIECAGKNHKILEINAFYGRLDLNDVWARRARDSGVKLAINTDAHGLADLELDALRSTGRTPRLADQGRRGQLPDLRQTAEAAQRRSEPAGSN